MHSTIIKSTCGKLAVITVAASAALPMAARAETHVLRPYAYVQSYGVNRVDTGYVPQPLSRLFMDFEVTTPEKGKGLMGCNGGDLKCVFYLQSTTAKPFRWYYRDGGSGVSTFMNGDSNRRVLNVTHATTSSETAVLDLYDRTSAVTKTASISHAATTTYPVNLYTYSAATGVESKAKVYCFEAADTSDQAMPTAFLAPATNAVGEAGFVDVMRERMFHGEAIESPSTALTYSDGVGSADDYKAEGGTLYAKFRAYAADDATGGVKFGSDAASGTAEAWVARGGMVTLTAVPAEGYEFVGWTGDTWALASGSTTTDAAVALTNASTVVQLLAKFREASWHWTGVAGDGCFFTPGNWADGYGAAAAALASGDKFTFDQAGAVTVNYNPASADFAIAKITFATGAGAVTVTNCEMHVAAIVVENGAENVMSNAVTFSGNIDVTATSGHVRFAGGATGSTIANHFDLYGDYMLTQSSFYVPHAGTVLKSGSTLRTPQSTRGIQAHEAQYSMESATTTTVAHAIIDRNSSGTLMTRNDGVFVVKNYMRIDGNDGSNPTHYFGSGDGVLIANEIRLEGNCRFVPPANTIIGPGGISMTSNNWIRVSNNGTHRIGAYADWELRHNAAGSAAKNPGIYKNTSSTPSSLTFDTTDYYDSSIGRTIIDRSTIRSSTPGTLSVAVVGKGTFKFACAGSFGDMFSGGLTVNDSATVSVNDGCWPGAGAVTLNDTATLEAAQSGTVSVSNLTLSAGTTLAFNFTASATAPTLALTEGATLPDEGTVNVKVTADGDNYATGTYTLVSGAGLTDGDLAKFAFNPELSDKRRGTLSVADGNLVLTVKPKTGIMLIVR